MRLFEVLLLLFSAALPAVRMSVGPGRRKTMLLAGASGTLLMAIQLAAEGYRAQMLFPYGFTIGFLAVSAYAVIRQTPARKMPRMLSVPLFVLASGAVLLTAGLLYAFPVFQLPEPTGPFPVGTQTFRLVDEGRNELFGNAPDGKRELMVQVWYPAQNARGKPAPWIPDAEKVLKEEPLSRSAGVPRAFLDYLKRIPSHSYESADISASSPSYPLVLLNHGYGTSRIFHTTQAENLASHGYIVASIDHTYSTFATVFPDGRTTTMQTGEDLIDETPYRDKVGQVWTDDISFVLDQLGQLHAGRIPSKLGGRIDWGRVGVFGHSFGGAASYDAAYDPRIKAGIDLDGSLYLDGKAPLAKPFLFIFSDSAFDVLNKAREHDVFTDEELEAAGMTREQYEEQLQDVDKQVVHLEYTARHSGPILYIKNSEHYNFTDLQFLTPLFRPLKLTGAIRPARAAALVNAYTLDFFDKYLKNQGGALLDGPNGEYPEVKFATSLFAGVKPQA